MAGWPHLGIRLDSERIDAKIDRSGKCGLQLQVFRVQIEPFERACNSALEPTGHMRHLVHMAADASNDRHAGFTGWPGIDNT